MTTQVTTSESSILTNLSEKLAIYREIHEFVKKRAETILPDRYHLITDITVCTDLVDIEYQDVDGDRLPGEAFSIADFFANDYKTRIQSVREENARREKVKSETIERARAESRREEDRKTFLALKAVFEPDTKA